MAALNFPFAASGARRVPTSGELTGGFSCGPADQELFNFLMWWTGGQIDAMIEAAGLTTDDSDLLQLAKAIRSQRMNWIAAAQVGGTADAITLTCDPAFANLAALVGVPLRFITEGTNTGPVTIAVDGLAATALTWPDGTALIAGELPANFTLEVWYDGTAFRAESPMSRSQVLQIAQPNFRAVSAKSQMVPNTTVTSLTDLALTHSVLSDATFVGGVLTIGPKTAGLWYFQNTVAFLSSTATQAYVVKNGAVAGNEAAVVTTTGNFSYAPTVVRLMAGDTVEARGYQNSGSSKANVFTNGDGGLFLGARISA